MEPSQYILPEKKVGKTKVPNQLVPAKMTHRNNEVIMIEDKVLAWCTPCSEFNVVSNKVCKMKACNDLPTPVQVDNCYESLKKLSYVSLHCEAGFCTVSSSIMSVEVTQDKNRKRKFNRRCRCCFVRKGASITKAQNGFKRICCI